MLTLTTTTSTATISPYGGQVMSYVKEGRDLLWQTEEHFLTKAQTENRALRGGIPVCWPWFNRYNSHPAAPAHGLARTSLWKVEKQTANTAVLSLETDGTSPFFPHKARATLTVALEAGNLHATLATTNIGTTPFKLTAALHTYLRVDDITETHVLGLGGHAHEGIGPTPFPSPFAFAGETDTIFSGVTAPVTIWQPACTTTVSNPGTPEAVLWNPWTEKASTLDMPPQSYRHFLCLESAVINTAPTLQPGQSHTFGTIIA